MKLTQEQIDLVCSHLNEQIFDLIGRRYHVRRPFISSSFGNGITYYDWHLSDQNSGDIEIATLQHTENDSISLIIYKDIENINKIEQLGFQPGSGMNQRTFKYYWRASEVLKELIGKNDTDAIVSMF